MITKDLAAELKLRITEALDGAYIRGYWEGYNMDKTSPRPESMKRRKDRPCGCGAPAEKCDRGCIYV